MPTQPGNEAGGSSPDATPLSSPTDLPAREPWRPADPARFRELLARVTAPVRPTQSPAMQFGAYVRKEVDAAAGRGVSALDLGRLLRLDPVGKAIEKLEGEIAATKADIARLRRRDRRVDAPKDGRKKDVCNALAKLMKKVLQELKDEGYSRAGAAEELIPTLKSKSPNELSKMLKEKLNIKISGRTIGAKNSKGEYKSQAVAEWSQYRNIPGVRPPSKPLPGSIDDMNKDCEEDPRRRAADKTRIDANEAVDGVDHIAKGNLRQTTRVDSGYGRLRKRSGDDLSERQMDADADACLSSGKQDPSKAKFRPIEGRPPATGKDQDELSNSFTNRSASSGLLAGDSEIGRR